MTVSELKIGQIVYVISPDVKLGRVITVSSDQKSVCVSIDNTGIVNWFLVSELYSSESEAGEANAKLGFI